MCAQVLRLNLDIDPATGVGTFSGDTFNAKEILKKNLSVYFKTPNWIARSLPVPPDQMSGFLRALFPGWIVAVNGEIDLSDPPPSAKEPEPPIAESVPSGALSVAELLIESERALRSRFPRPILVYGVISKLNIDKKGERLFLDLSPKDDPGSFVSCVVWSNLQTVLAPLKRLGFELEENLEVMFEVNVALNKKRGSLSLTIIRIDETFLIGKLAALREQTNNRLKAEGIFANNRALALSTIPRRLVLLTSATGTVIHDFLSSLAVARFGFELFIRHVNVQGASAKAQLLKAITVAAETPDIDAIVIFRGGGSVSELSLFSDYEVARAVCLSPVPVASAIGHEQDQSSVQDVSFRAFGVPKDIGRFFADLILDKRRAVNDLQQSVSTTTEVLLQKKASTLQILTYELRDLSRSWVGKAEQRLVGVCRSIPGYAEVGCERSNGALKAVSALTVNTAHRMIEQRFALIQQYSSAVHALSAKVHVESMNRIRLIAERLLAVVHREISVWEVRTSAFRRLPSAMAEVRSHAENRVEMLEALVRSSAPEVQLKRGFALVRSRIEGKVVRSPSDVPVGTQIEIELHDGKLNATISK